MSTKNRLMTTASVGNTTVYRHKAQVLPRVGVAPALTLVGVCSTSPTFAGVVLNTIDPVALVTGNGRRILVTGPIACTRGERAALRVMVTQRPTGAVAGSHSPHMHRRCPAVGSPCREPRHGALLGKDPPPQSL